MGKETVYNHRKLPARDIGDNAPRSCTNPLCCFLFIAIWVGFAIFCIAVVFKLGDSDRLIYGVDYEGHTCARGDVGNLVFSGDGEQGDHVGWKDRKKLWYPLSFSLEEGYNFKSARNQGICVSSCPSAGDANGKLERLAVYKDVKAGETLTVPSSYPVLFDSSERFNRCIPNIFSFRCDQLEFGTRTACFKAMNKTQLLAEEIYTTVQDGVNELRRDWWIVFVCTVLAVVICFIWMFCLRRLVKPFTVFSIILVGLALFGCGLFLYLHSKTLPHGSDSSRAYYAGGIIVWCVGFLYLCVIAFLFKDIMVACDIIEEASKVPIKIPTIMTVPTVAVLFMIPFAIFAIFVTVNIYTAAKTFDFKVPEPQFNGHLANTTMTVKQYQSENWRTYAYIFNLFMFLWSIGFVNAVAYMVVAMCGVFWYWSNPGDDKNPEHGVLRATKLTFIYHLGTLALGSLVVAVIQVIRVIFVVLAEHMRKMAERSGSETVGALLGCWICCMNCCLSCFERIIKFINKNAYIITAMTGEGY